jgi:hypothetical protein
MDNLTKAKISDYKIAMDYLQEAKSLIGIAIWRLDDDLPIVKEGTPDAKLWDIMTQMKDVIEMLATEINESKTF